MKIAFDRVEQGIRQELGFCVDCGGDISNCEPDTKPGMRTCPSCSSVRVFGAEELVIHGERFIDFGESPDPDPVRTHIADRSGIPAGNLIVVRIPAGTPPKARGVKLLSVRQFLAIAGKSKIDVFHAILRHSDLACNARAVFRCLRKSAAGIRCPEVFKDNPPARMIEQTRGFLKDVSPIAELRIDRDRPRYDEEFDRLVVQAETVGEWYSVDLELLLACERHAAAPIVSWHLARQNGGRVLTDRIFGRTQDGEIIACLMCLAQE